MSSQKMPRGVWIPDTTPWILDSTSWILDFTIFGFRNPLLQSFWAPNSTLWISESTPSTTESTPWIPDSEADKVGF